AHIDVNFDPTDDGSLIDDEGDPPVHYLAPYKEPADAIHPYAHYNQRVVRAQDHMAWETQGPIADRGIEHLSYSDRGVHMLRKMMRDNIERVRQGVDPLGIVRDPNHPMIDTHLSGEAQGFRGDVHPAGVAVETVPVS